MHIIGLTGGIASGKSAVAAELERLGAVVLDADEAAHEVINCPSVQSALVERWGDSIVTADGQIDRAAVAERVFADDEKGRSELDFLEKTLHPRIRDQFDSTLAALSEAGTRVAVIDAPLLLEAGWESLCDGLVFVESPRADRLERASRRNWTEDEFAKREAHQLPIADKRSRSTHTLVNPGTLAGLRDEVARFWASLELQ